jgi:YidC/Oxa1 family membrane protein insertase
MSWYDTLLHPIMVVVAWIMVGVHDLLTAVGLDAESGVTWTLSIVALVVVIRVLLIPLFVRQIRAARAMQMLSPELQALQKKYKGRTDPASREAMTRETMELYRKHGTNPFSSCLPILAQSPIFFALFRVLNNLGRIASGEYPTVGPMDQATAQQAENAELFGAPISSWFFQEGATTQVKIVTVALIVAMSVTTFTTQKQLTQKNMPASAMQGPMAQQQKMLLYLLPLVFAISGVNFPIGVLIYWTTTNLWSMGQQFYVIRRNPTPGSEAERLLKERRARKAAAKGLPIPEEPTEPVKPKGQRQQPVRKDRARGAGPRPAPKPGAGKPGPKPAAGAPKPAGTGQAPKSGGPKAGAGKPGGPKAGPGKPGASKPGAGKPGAGKPGAGKPGAGKPGNPGGVEGTPRPRPKKGGAGGAPKPGQATPEPGEAKPTDQDER